MVKVNNCEECKWCLKYKPVDATLCYCNCPSVIAYYKNNRTVNLNGYVTFGKVKIEGECGCHFEPKEKEKVTVSINNPESNSSTYIDNNQYKQYSTKMKCESCLYLANNSKPFRSLSGKLTYSCTHPEVINMEDYCNRGLFFVEEGKENYPKNCHYKEKVNLQELEEARIVPSSGYFGNSYHNMCGLNPNGSIKKESKVEKLLNNLKSNVTTGVKIKAAGGVASLLIEKAKNLLGANYPKFFESELGKKLEPFVITAVVNAVLAMYENTSPQVKKAKDISDLALQHHSGALNEVVLSFIGNETLQQLTEVAALLCLDDTK